MKGSVKPGRLARAAPGDLSGGARRRVAWNPPRTPLPQPHLVAALFVAFACARPSSAPAADVPGHDALLTASRIVRSSGASGGICVVVASRDGAAPAGLALALAKQGRFVVHCLTSPDRLDGTRETIRARGLYGTVSADALTGGRLPYANNLVNIVVVDSRSALAGERTTPKEVLRVLAPLGTAHVGTRSPSAVSRDRAKELSAAFRALGAVSAPEEVSVVEEGGTWVRVRKPWPPDIDEWTHYLHGPDGNPVARDLVVGPPKRWQWVAGPVWLRSHETDSSVSTLVTARGRLFAIVDEAPISLAGDHPPRLRIPDKWFLIARDAFNGILLWQVPIRRWGWREWKGSWFNTRPGDVPLNVQKRLVAVAATVYVTLGYRAPVSELDARTGEILRTYDGTERTNEILHVPAGVGDAEDATLVLSVLGGDGGSGVRVKAVDAATGAIRWVTEKSYEGTTVDYVKWNTRYGKTKPPRLDPTLNTATDGRVVALIDGSAVVALDFQTGDEKWRSPFPLDQADVNAGGIRTKGKLWVGTMIVSDGAVVHASPGRLAAFSARDGTLLWSRPKQYIGHLWYEWKDVFVIDGVVWTWGADLRRGEFDRAGRGRQSALYPQSVNGYDLTTGEVVKSVPLGTVFKAHHHHRCYRNKATSRYILASRRGTEFIDLVDGRHTVHNWVRGTCHVGMMPANGLQYAPPHPCVCYIDEKLNGMIALAPAGRDPGDGVGDGAGGEAGRRLERGPAFGAVADREAKAAASDWPAFRHDSMRTGSVETEVPDDAIPLWRARPGGRASAPTVVRGKLFAALVNEHHVLCLDIRDGRTLWEVAAGGRVDSPPTYYRGTVIFGSADGWVYCLRASDGEVVWRFRAAPAERLVASFGQLESAWPVHGSVLVQDGAAYFAAGRSSMLDGGIYLFGVDAATGRPRHSARLDGPHYDVGNVEENYLLPMGALPDVLMCDGSRIYMRSRTFDLELERATGRSDLQAKGGLLDESYFKRTPWTFAGAGYGRLIVHDARTVYGVRMFDSLRGLDPAVYFTPGDKGYLLFAKSAKGVKTGASAWSKRIPVRVRAMVLAGARLFVAGPPDVVDPRDPLGAFEGRKGGLLYTIDAATGDTLAEHSLPAPPVFNGMAAANGRLYLAGEDGGITCFGAP